MPRKFPESEPPSRSKKTKNRKGEPDDEDDSSVDSKGNIRNLIDYEMDEDDDDSSYHTKES